MEILETCQRCCQESAHFNFYTRREAGLDGGRLVAAADGAPVTIAMSADREAFERLLLTALPTGRAALGL